VFSSKGAGRVKYAQVGTSSEFDTIINDKSHKHVVVWFYYYAQEGEKKNIAQNMSTADYESMRTLFNKVADVEQYKDKASRFVAINVATKEGERIFDNYSVLDDGTLVELPAILLFRNGRMIDNQMGGVMTEKRVESFIERYFK
jgi:hypothetical protein